MKSLFMKIVLLSAVIALSGCGEEKKAVVSPQQPAVAKVDNFENVTIRLKDPAFGSVDGINGVTAPPSGTVIPIADDKIRIGGFAVDAIRGEAAAGVIVLIDDKPFVAMFGGDRPDIAKALNNPKYLKSQFYVETPAVSLGKGSHDVKFRVIASDRSGYYESAWSAKIDIK